MDSGERVSSSRNPSRYPLLRTQTQYLCVSVLYAGSSQEGESCYPGRNTKGRRPTKGCGGQRLQTGQA